MEIQVFALKKNWDLSIYLPILIPMSVSLYLYLITPIIFPEKQEL